MSKVAIILSGCGYLDGAEIHESTLLLLCLSQKGHTYSCFAPNAEFDVVDHLSGEKTGEKRSILLESARIARGKVQPLDKLDVDAFDALALPGGFGAATTLCDFASRGAECTTIEPVKEAILAFYHAKKPILATCIAPVVVAAALKGVAEIEMTLGSDPKNAEALWQMGMKGKIAKVSEAALDSSNKVYTTPCYMEPDDLAGMFKGISEIVSRIS